ncbi:hypothetical protein AC628_29645 [Bradyrhizobium sp. NAS96.2]|nr:hypothetical protein AC628_29645 [Bradyrhizobium sp. NAS96.2]
MLCRAPLRWQAAATSLILPPPYGKRSRVGALKSSDKGHCAIDRASPFEVCLELLSDRCKRGKEASSIKQIAILGS